MKKSKPWTLKKLEKELLGDEIGKNPKEIIVKVGHEGHTTYVKTNLGNEYDLTSIALAQAEVAYFIRN